MTQLPFGRPLTCAGLDRMPDDGHRYELLDGVLVVSPASAGGAGRRLSRRERAAAAGGVGGGR
ncbi:hypothetical protein [Actinopolymorpha rutila]|uniref:Uncharacterized protein n=1 Tax=Actinopolymorpha rutila TaxID=446787 RepID=A0A852ZDN4_9ACTN|nr:hypothetical protein [Actinopolymorpha rutila]NYH91014.1 hypothetical protein [Actinopolymorpha rutila]